MIIWWPARIKDKGGLRIQFHHIMDIAPAILEAAGVQAPNVLNGTPQVPIHGISMSYTFDDAKAPDRRRQQVFEMFGNRGIYQNGWFASSVAIVPWDAARLGKASGERNRRGREAHIGLGRPERLF
jgi:arylsulfatase A-like enzyme